MTLAPPAPAEAAQAPPQRPLSREPASSQPWSRLPGGIDAVTLLTVFVVLMLGLNAWLVVGPLGGAATPANVIGLLGLLWWISAWLHRGLALDRERNPVRAACLAFLLAVLASYVAANTRVTSVKEVSAADRGLIAVLCWLGIMLIACDAIQSMDRLEVLLRRVAIGGGLLGLVGLVQFYTGSNPLAAIRPPGLTATFEFSELTTRASFVRVNGTATHPIECGVVFAALLPFAFHFAMQPDGSPLRRRLRWTGVLLLLAVLPMTLSRSGMLAATVTMTIVFFGWPRRTKIGALIIAPFLLVGVRLAVPGLIGTVRSMFSNIASDPSTTGRTDDYTTVAHYVDQAPLFGRGFRTYLPESYRILDNQFLGGSVELGLVGLAALLMLFVAPICCGVVALRRLPDPRHRSLARALVASVFAVMLSYATFDAFSFSQIASLSFLLLGCCGAIWRLSRDAASASPASPGSDPLQDLVQARSSNPPTPRSRRQGGRGSRREPVPT